MQANSYRIIRGMHLYPGLFISPFLLLFAFSVFTAVHPAVSRDPQKEEDRRVSGLSLDPSIENLTGRARVEALRPVLKQAGVQGEIGFIRHDLKNHRLFIPVVVPGRNVTVDMDLHGRSALISAAETGLAASSGGAGSAETGAGSGRRSRSTRVGAGLTRRGGRSSHAH